VDYINIDFETFSTTNLRDSGVYRYVEDPTTGIWCMAYAKGDLEPQIWVAGEDFPPELLYWIQEGHGLRAWNAQFERLVWNTVGVERYGFPLLPRMKFHCTQADALAMGLPAALGKAAEALRLPVEKDMKGNRLAIQMSKPRSTDPLTWWNDTDRLNRLYEYCKQDVVVEREIMRITRRVSDSERSVYLMDQMINDRGVRLDKDLAVECQEIAFEGITRANETVLLHTKGEVDAVTKVAAIQHWLVEQGVFLPDLRATTLQNYLQTNLPVNVREVLVARSEAGKASVKKLRKMLQMICVDGRLHGLLQYHAAHTGRWGGRGVQPQNFPRGTVKDAEQYITAIFAQVPYDVLDLQENPIDIVLSLLRSMLIASSGNTLMSADFSAIEARVLAWLAEDTDLLQQFADHDAGVGKEVYMIAAEELDTSRQHAKAIILGAGFGMGWKKFKKMCHDAYGIDINDEEAKKFIKWYRDKHKAIKQFWQDLEDGVLGAVKHPGVVFYRSNGRLRFVMRGSHLWIILPSGRPLCYIEPRLVERETPWGTTRLMVEISTQDSFTHKWVRRDLYGGLIAENIVQAASRDLLVYSMQQVESGGYPVVLTVHDEIVADVPINETLTFERFTELVSSTPEWAVGCPVKASGWHGKRYRKG
jgi:DNA polymerase